MIGDEVRETTRAKLEAAQAKLPPPPEVPRATCAARQALEEGRLHWRLSVPGRPCLIDAMDKQIRQAAPCARESRSKASR